MSRKNYIAVANAVNAQVTRWNGDTSMDAAVRVSLNDLANDLADHFAADNPNFDRTRFKDACGLITGTGALTGV